MNIATATQLIADCLAANLIGADVAQAANAAIRQSAVYGDELNDSNRGRLLSLAFGIRTSSPVNFAPAYTVLED